MSKRVELPLLEPLYSTYQYQGPCTAITVNNPSIRNWCLNERMNLTCTRKFLNGFTTPEVTIPDTSWYGCPYFERIRVSSKFVKGHINRVIRQMLDEGYYVTYHNVDDFYVEGKSGYHKRHLNHDGMICGYDQSNKTYCLYSYDDRWIYRKFWTSQRSFNKGRIAMEKQGIFSTFYALKVNNDVVEFSPKTVITNLKEYLDSDLEKYPFEGEDRVFGIIVHAYIADYVSKLYRGDIPYDKMDRRVFRLIWEHKKAMLERIELVENSLGINDTISKLYTGIVKDADTMRMLYASHYIKRRDSVLPYIQKMIIKLMQEERKLLEELVEIMEKRFENETMESTEK